MNNIKAHIDVILDDNPHKIVITNPKDKQREIVKIEIVKNEDIFHIAKYTKTQVFHENLSDVSDYIAVLFNDYLQGDFIAEKYNYSIRISKKGKVLTNKSRADNKINSEGTHNRKKQYILKEGQIISPLIDIGIFTPDGRVVKSMYSKYKQINRFIEIIDDSIRRGNYKKLSILDFGCGKSYLTFILYYYLTEIRHINVKMVGLDLKSDVIKRCNDIAAKYSYDGLKFKVGDINSYSTEGDIDMVISLHACDLATDYSLYNAIKWNAKMIFAVPCCQHEVNAQIKTDDYNILTKYGLIKERVSSLMTDAIRANMLTYCSYKTQIIEFVDFEHSPKNILIRAVKANISQNKRDEALAEVKRLNETFGCDQALYRMTMEDNNS